MSTHIHVVPLLPSTQSPAVVPSMPAPDSGVGPVGRIERGHRAAFPRRRIGSLAAPKTIRGGSYRDDDRREHVQELEPAR
jgi:hypothetical protein